MKPYKIISKIIVAQLWIFMIAPLFAQSQPPIKIGIVDFELVFRNILNTQQVIKELKEYENKMMEEYDIRYEKILAIGRGSPYQPDSLYRQKLEGELQRSQDELQKFQQQARIDFEQKKQKLLTIIYKKVQKGIEEYAIKNNYTYIFLIDMILFSADTETAKHDDITEKVLLELGGKMPYKGTD